MSIELLKKKIAMQGVSIDNLPKATTISPEDTIEVLQNGINKSLSVSTLFESIGNSIYRVEGKNLTLVRAINRVPSEKREAGAIITFHNIDSNDWEIYQYNSTSTSNFLNSEMWVKLGGTPVTSGISVFRTIEEFERHSKTHGTNLGVIYSNTGPQLYVIGRCGTPRLLAEYNKTSPVSDLKSEDVKIDIVCPTYPKVQTQLNKPYRRGESVYVVNEQGEEELLFNITDSESTCNSKDTISTPPKTYSLTIIGDFKEDVNVFPILGDLRGYIVTSEALSVIVTALDKEGYQFSHFKYNGTILPIEETSNSYYVKKEVFRVIEGKENITLEPVYKRLENNTNTTPAEPTEPEYLAVINASPLQGSGSLDVTYTVNLYKNGRPVTPESIKGNNQVRPNNTIIFTEGEHTLTVTATFEGREFTKKFPVLVDYVEHTNPVTLTLVGEYKQYATIISDNRIISEDSVTRTGRLNAIVDLRRARSTKPSNLKYIGYKLNGGPVHKADSVNIYFNEDTTVEPVFEVEDAGGNENPAPKNPCDLPISITTEAHGNGRIVPSSLQITVANKDYFIDFLPDAGYKVDRDRRLTNTSHRWTYVDEGNANATRMRLTSNTCPTTHFVAHFILKHPTKAYSNGTGYNPVDDTTVLVTPNQCYTDGSTTPSFSVTINANEIPFSSYEAPEGTTVVLSENKLNATITYNCTTLLGNKPVITITDNAGRRVTVNLDDFKTPQTNTDPQPTKTPLTILNGNKYLVDLDTKTVYVENSCHISHGEPSEFNISIPYSGDLKEYVLEGFNNEQVIVEYNPNTKNIDMRFICTALQGLKDGIVKLLDWFGNTWKVILGPYKPDPVKPKETYNVRIIPDSGVSGYRVTYGEVSNRYTTSETLSIPKDTNVTIEALLSEGKEFASMDGQSQNPYTFTANGDKEIYIYSQDSTEYGKAREIPVTFKFVDNKTGYTVNDIPEIRGTASKNLNPDHPTYSTSVPELPQSAKEAGYTYTETTDNWTADNAVVIGFENVEVTGVPAIVYCRVIVPQTIKKHTVTVYTYTGEDLSTEGGVVKISVG